MEISNRSIKLFMEISMLIPDSLLGRNLELTLTNLVLTRKFPMPVRDSAKGAMGFWVPGNLPGKEVEIGMAYCQTDKTCRRKPPTSNNR